MARRRNRHQRKQRHSLASNGEASQTTSSKPPPTLALASRLREANEMYIRWLAVMVLGLLIAVSYFPAIGAGFVWDDGVWSDTPVLQGLAGLREIWLSPGSIHNEAHYWPVLYTTFWIEHALWGLAPHGYHLVNLVLHFAVTLLLWRLLNHLTVPGGWLIAAVFAVHPMHVESVAWVIGRKDVLATLFYLSAALMYLRFMETRANWRYAIALLLFIAGMLSKSIAVTLPATLLLWQWWQHGRISMADIKRVSPFFLFGLVFVLGDVYLTRITETIISGYSWYDRLIIVAHNVWFYVGKIMLPTDLAVIYPRWEISAENMRSWFYVASFAAVLGLLWHYRRSLGRAPLAGVLFFVIALSPTLGLVDYGYMRYAYVADRFQYLGGIGLLASVIAAGVVGTRKWRRMPNQTVQGLFVAGLLMGMSILSWQQSNIYQNEETFFSHIIAHNPRALSAHYNLGNEYRRQQRLDEALANYRIALNRRPKYEKTHTNIGLTFMDLGQLEEAEKHLQFVLKLKPKNLNGLVNLAALRFKQKRYEESLKLYQSALAIDPDFALAKTGLNLVLKHTKQTTE